MLSTIKNLFCKNSPRLFICVLKEFGREYKLTDLGVFCKSIILIWATSYEEAEEILLRATDKDFVRETLVPKSEFNYKNHYNITDEQVIKHFKIKELNPENGVVFKANCENCTEFFLRA